MNLICAQDKYTTSLFTSRMTVQMYKEVWRYSYWEHRRRWLDETTRDFQHAREMCDQLNMLAGFLVQIIFNPLTLAQNKQNSDKDNLFSLSLTCLIDLLVASSTGRRHRPPVGLQNKTTPTYIALEWINNNFVSIDLVMCHVCSKSIFNSFISVSFQDVDL